MPNTAEKIAALQTELPHMGWSTLPLDLKRLSRDFHWFSPVLKRQLDGKRADAIAHPRDEAALSELVATCVRDGIPLTVRGGGTGNYGQAVPLQGGIVVDMSSCKQLLWVRDGIARAQAGIRLSDLADQLSPLGHELRFMPSTYRMASLGGLFCGGFGGIGSINYGPVAAPGNILGIRLMTIEAEPRILELRTPEALRHAHAYGTNGIVLELEFTLAPARQWDEYLLAFPDFDSAFSAAQALAGSPGIAKRNVAVMANTTARHFIKFANELRESEHVVIAILAPESGQPMEQILHEHKGRVAWWQDAATAATTPHTLQEYCWNHTTLHALRENPNLTYLQSGYTIGQEREQLAAIAREAGDEVMAHIEFIRDTMGNIICAGLPLIRFTTEERLAELTALHRSLGIKINNPHVYTLEDGKHAEYLDPAILEAKRQFDPHGLLNPGKVRTLDAPERDAA